MLLGLTLVCFSYYFFQVFFTANIETKELPTYVYIMHRGDDWQAGPAGSGDTGGRR
ncbi:MAG: hypothetical protein WKG07_00500 [Hymenobacter sp.]